MPRLGDGEADWGAWWLIPVVAQAATGAIARRAPVVIFLDGVHPAPEEPAQAPLAWRVLRLPLVPAFVFGFEELEEIHDEYLLRGPGIEHAWPHPQMDVPGSHQARGASPAWPARQRVLTTMRVRRGWRGGYSPMTAVRIPELHFYGQGRATSFISLLHQGHLGAIQNSRFRAEVSASLDGARVHALG